MAEKKVNKAQPAAPPNLAEDQSVTIPPTNMENLSPAMRLLVGLSKRELPMAPDEVEDEESDVSAED